MVKIWQAIGINKTTEHFQVFYNQDKCITHMTTVNDVQWESTFVLVKRRQNAVILTNFEVDFLLHTISDCTGRDDDGHSCINKERYCHVLYRHV